MHPCCEGFRSYNTLSPRQDGRHFPDDISKFNYLNENVQISINISLKFAPKGPTNNIQELVQVKAWHRPGDKPLSEPMEISLLTHICVTRHQWLEQQTTSIIDLTQNYRINQRILHVLASAKPDSPLSMNVCSCNRCIYKIREEVFPRFFRWYVSHWSFIVWNRLLIRLHFPWQIAWGIHVQKRELMATNRWNLGIDKWFHPTPYNGWNYLSMPGLQLIHVSKRPLQLKW